MIFSGSCCMKQRLIPQVQCVSSHAMVCAKDFIIVRSDRIFLAKNSLLSRSSSRCLFRLKFLGVFALENPYPQWTMDNYGRCFIHEISLDLFVKETKNQKKVSKARLLLHLFLLIQLSLAQDSALLFLCSSASRLKMRSHLARTWLKTAKILERNRCRFRCKGTRSLRGLCLFLSPGPFAPSPKARENGCASLFSSPLDAVCHVLPSVIAPDIPMAWCCGLATSWAGACFCPAWPCVAAPRFAGAWCGKPNTCLMHQTQFPHVVDGVFPCNFPGCNNRSLKSFPAILKLSRAAAPKNTLQTNVFPILRERLQTLLILPSASMLRTLGVRTRHPGPTKKAAACRTEKRRFSSATGFSCSFADVARASCNRCSKVASLLGSLIFCFTAVRMTKYSRMLEDHIFQSKCQWHQSANGFCNNKSHSSSLFLLWWCHTCFWSSSSVWQLYL